MVIMSNSVPTYSSSGIIKIRVPAALQANLNMPWYKMVFCTLNPNITATLPRDHIGMKAKRHVVIKELLAQSKTAIVLAVGKYHVS